MKKAVFFILFFSALLMASFVVYQWLLYGRAGDEPRAEVQSTTTLEEATNADAYIKYRRMSRADKNGNIPMDALVKAKQHIDRMRSSRDAGLWNWEWLGPSNIGGRIRTILPDPDNPDVIWIGSVSGGIWKSINSGASWSPVDDFMTNLAITSLVFDPSSTNIMYAATGEGFGNHDGLPGAGIFKSTDGGVTWNQLSSTNNDNFKAVNRLAAHPDPDSVGVIYAVTATSHVYKTTDGGNTWVNKLNPASRPTDIKVNINAPSEVIVGCMSDVYISYDYGETWTNQTTGANSKLPSDGGRCEVSFCPSMPSTIFVSMDRNGGEIWRSTDNGVVWEKRYEGIDYLGTQGWYDNALWVYPWDCDFLIVGGIDLYRSTNGGTSLTKISDWHDYHNGGNANSAHADHHFIVEAADFDDNNPEVYFANDGGIQKTDNVWTVSENSGWVNLAGTSLGITQFFSGACSNDGSIIVGGAQDNDKLRYKSSGSWSGPDNWYEATTGDGGFSAVDYNNNNIVYGEYIYLNISKSTNGGDSYNSAISGLSDAGNGHRALFIAPFSMDPNDPTILVAGGSRIWRTTNSAATWSQIRAEIGINYIHNDDTIYYKCSAIDIDDGNSDIIWVGYDNGHVAKTTNAGTSWTKVNQNDVWLPYRFVTDIAINPNNSNEVFVTFGGYHNDNVWYTPDAGDTWENRSGTAPNDLPALQVNTVRFHPATSDWIYIGTDLGVFATEDRGLNWSIVTKYPDNEGPVNTEVDELFWQGTEFLIAATHGRGMFRTATPTFKIYVDANAAPGGDGSQSHPFQTVYEAAQAYGPGTTISIESGNYDETHVINLLRKGYIIVTNGTVTIY